MCRWWLCRLHSPCRNRTGTQHETCLCRRPRLRSCVCIPACLRLVVQAISRTVFSRQTTKHKNLSCIVRRHLATQYKQPIRNFNVQIFKHIESIKNICHAPVILDSGCGTGESTRLIAREFSSSLVIGIDKSLHRLRRSGLDVDEGFIRADNYILARMNIIDFWRLANDASWQLQKHFILFPNPWPKPAHLKRRWHAHPVFPFLLLLGGHLELRTNWNIYAQEFSTAITVATNQTVIPESYTPESTISPFEKKYLASRHILYRCKVNLGKS